ncbi:MAG: hypothetical protein GWN18_02705 [Thermoplasmata archaeon]|nr:hypothetical protein [Thermoplasmata archaeon]NIS13714.1 hypothetical protein [Thermoplasmata archaeon]NIS18855.1 hypothetical protein [Thermoplasmata archaeon]NIT75883.1 hypothetical protein [Thermoplasmata archaeon]NIU48010.1 hypothetical protein [Thermoplasmata archaeon]
MSYHLEVVFIVPSARLTEGRLSSTLDALRALPNSSVPSFAPLDPGRPLSHAQVGLLSADVNSLEIIASSSLAEAEDETLILPDWLDYIVLSVPEGNLLFIDGQHDRLLEVILAVFENMGALYAVTLHELALAVERLKFDDLKRELGGVHVFSTELVERVGMDRFAFDGKIGETGGAVWLRFGKEFFYGAPTEYHEALEKLIGDAWRNLFEGEVVKKPSVDEADLDDVPDEPTDPKEEKVVVRLDAGDYSVLLPFRSAGFFFWAYYPEENHTMERMRGFHRELLGGNVGNEEYFESRVRNWFKGSADFDSVGFPVGDPPSHFVYTNIMFHITSGREGLMSNGPGLTREGCVGVIMRTQGDLGAFEDPRSSMAVIRFIEVFTRHFEPVYGFGHGNYNQFCHRYQMLPPHEERIWPMNVFDLDRYDRTLEERAREYWMENIEDWCLRKIAGRWMMLHSSELSLPEERVPLDVTERVLGSAEDKLTPRP